MTPTQHFKQVTDLLGNERVALRFSRSWSPETIFALWFLSLMVLLAAGVFVLSR